MFEQQLRAASKPKTEFIWDGLDYLGRPVNGKVAAHVNVGYVDDSKYMAFYKLILIILYQKGEDWKAEDLKDRFPKTWKKYTQSFVFKI